MSATSPLRIEAQRVLDELWSEKLLPFQLNVGELTNEERGYTIHFYDSRITTARILLAPGELFKDAVRAAVLDRVRGMSGPLRAKPQ